jgi:arsenite methyltransferase
MIPGYDTSPAPGGLELTQRVIAAAAIPSGARIVDIGCGSGDTVEWLRRRGFNAVGVDCSTAQFRKDVPVLQARAECLPFPTASVNAVLAQCSLSITSSQPTALAECARVLARGGKMLVTDVYAGNPQEFVQRLADASFELSLWEDCSNVLKLWWARHLWEAESPLPCGCCSEMRSGYFLLIAQKQGENANAR